MKNTNSATCPRCGSKYKAGKWCQCGYQGEIGIKSFEAYLFAMTVDELRTLCKMHGVKMDSWKQQTKDDMIDEMADNDKLRKALGFKPKNYDEEVADRVVKKVSPEHAETADKIKEAMKKAQKKLAQTK